MQETYVSPQPDPARFFLKNARKAVFFNREMYFAAVVIVVIPFNRNDNWLLERNALAAFTDILNGLQSLVIVIQL